MATNATEIFKKNHLSMELTPISIRELFFLDSTPVDIFVYEDGIFEAMLLKGAFLDNAVLSNLITSGHSMLFVHGEQRNDLIEIQQENLRNITRSFSMGNALENCKKQLTLLCINMRYLYEDPINDDILNLQFQSIKILFKFLYNNTKYHEAIYKEFIKQGHHYIFAQPFISSFFLLGLLKYSHLFNERDIENLFIASYFKDIGMSSIPIESFDKPDLTDQEKEILTKHPDLSVEILKGRIQLTPEYLNIIECHHTFSILKEEIDYDIGGSEIAITGIETNFVNIADIIAAMITPRPYREAETLYSALARAKELLGEDHPQEFKIVLSYFKNFFASMM